MLNYLSRIYTNNCLLTFLNGKTMPTGPDMTPFFTPEVNKSNVKSKPTPKGLVGVVISEIVL